MPIAASSFAEVRLGLAACSQCHQQSKLSAAVCQGVECLHNKQYLYTVFRHFTSKSQEGPQLAQNNTQVKRPWCTPVKFDVAPLKPLRDRKGNSVCQHLF